MPLDTRRWRQPALGRGFAPGIDAGRRSRGLGAAARRGLVLVWAGIGLSLILGADASAEYIHPFVKRFGSFSRKPIGAEIGVAVDAVAVDSSTGDVYVYESGNSRVLKFNASGEPANFSATGTNAIEGLETAINATAEIAVDNSPGPAKGDIYIASIGGEGGSQGNLGIYSRTGERLGAIPSGVKGICGVAVDASGNVYIPVGSRVDKYEPKGNPVTDADYASSAESVTERCQLGADSLGDIYEIGWTRGPVERVDASQFGASSPAGSVVDREGSSVAIDPFNDEVYVDERTQISQFGPNGEPFERPVSTFGASGSGTISDSVGIAVSGYNHDVYVSSDASISVFGPLGLVPTVETGAASNVQSHAATVSGTVNPEGLAVTECKVEYGTDTAYGQSQPCVESAGEIGSGTSRVEVHANLTGLATGAIYHYRVVVANANGRGEGADESVALPGPPVVSSESFWYLYETEGNVGAHVNPQLRSTTYRVEYGTSEAYGQSTPESAPVGSDGNSHAVGVHIGDLEPGTTYHFRFVATNEVGSTAGMDAKFTTFAASSTGEGGLVQPSPGGECVAGECFSGSASSSTTVSAPSQSSSGATPRLLVKPVAKSLTRAQKLVRALKACRRKKGKVRHRCEANARKRYGHARAVRRR